MGDGMLALFPKSPKDAIYAAVDMTARIKEYRYNEHSVSILIEIILLVVYIYWHRD
jgi:hypothetical protein